MLTLSFTGTLFPHELLQVKLEEFRVNTTEDCTQLLHISSSCCIHHFSKNLFDATGKTPPELLQVPSCSGLCWALKVERTAATETSFLLPWTSSVPQLGFDLLSLSCLSYGGAMCQKQQFSFLKTETQVLLLVSC